MYECPPSENSHFNIFVFFCLYPITIKVKEHVRSTGVHFHRTGLGGQKADSFSPRVDSYVKDHPSQTWKMKTLSEILTYLGHQNVNTPYHLYVFRYYNFSNIFFIIHTRVMCYGFILLCYWNSKNKLASKQTHINVGITFTVTTPFWNNHNQMCSKSKDWKTQ